jgi:hypothetical protein
MDVVYGLVADYSWSGPQWESRPGRRSAGACGVHDLALRLSALAKGQSPAIMALLPRSWLRRAGIMVDVWRGLWWVAVTASTAEAKIGLF